MFAMFRQISSNFAEKKVILEQCKGVHCVDLGESFQIHILLQNLASMQPRTSPVKFARSKKRSSHPDDPPAEVMKETPPPLEDAAAQALRSEVNSELNFPPKLRGARSRLYRRRFLQVNTRWKALAEIYTMHSFKTFSNLNFFVKNRQFFLR